MRWFNIYSTDHSEILLTSRQSKILLRSIEYVFNYNTSFLIYLIWNSIEIPLVGRGPGFSYDVKLVAWSDFKGTQVHATSVYDIGAYRHT